MAAVTELSAMSGLVLRVTTTACFVVPDVQTVYFPAGSIKCYRVSGHVVKSQVMYFLILPESVQSEKSVSSDAWGHLSAMTVAVLS